MSGFFWSEFKELEGKVDDLERHMGSIQGAQFGETVSSNKELEGKIDDLERQVGSIQGVQIGETIITEDEGATK